MMRRIIWGTLMACLLSLGLVCPVSAATGDSADDPIVLADPSDAPQGAVTDGPVTNDESCETTQTWILTIPAVDSTEHLEHRYLREVPAVEEISHSEWGVEERTRGFHEVTDYKTQYHFRKFTHTKERGPDLWWNFSPNNDQTVFIGAPGWPTDGRGTWQGPHENGGPQQDRYGTFANGNPLKGGNWFHRDEGQFGDYGPWTPWEPETHTSWEDSNTPLGSPEFHGEGDGWYREWQAQWDGQTRQVEVGSHNEFEEWSPWQDQAVHLLEEPTVPLNNDYHEWRINGPVKVVDSEAVAGYTEYYVLDGQPSLNEADASWVTESPGEGWTEFDERSVSNNDGTPEVVTHYAWSDHKVCPPPSKPPTTEPPSVGPPPTVTHHTPKKPITPVAHALPNTGGPDLGWWVLGAALLLSGGALVMTALRRGRQH